MCDSLNYLYFFMEWWDIVLFGRRLKVELVMPSSLEDLSQDCTPRFIMYLFVRKGMLMQINF